MSHVEDNDAVKTINRQIEQMKKRAEAACIKYSFNIVFINS